MEIWCFLWVEKDILKHCLDEFGDMVFSVSGERHFETLLGWILVFRKAVKWIKWLGVELSPPKPRFDPRPVHVKFVVKWHCELDKSTLALQISFNTIHPCKHIHPKCLIPYLFYEESLAFIYFFPFCQHALPKPSQHCLLNSINNEALHHTNLCPVMSVYCPSHPILKNTQFLFFP